MAVSRVVLPSVLQEKQTLANEVEAAEDYLVNNLQVSHSSSWGGWALCWAGLTATIVRRSFPAAFTLASQPLAPREVQMPICGLPAAFRGPLPGRFSSWAAANRVNPCACSAG